MIQNSQSIMKEIKAIIQPAMLSRVIEALKNIVDLPGVTVSEVKGFGKSRAADAMNKREEDEIEYSKKVKVEIVIPENRVEDIHHHRRRRCEDLHGAARARGYLNQKPIGVVREPMSDNLRNKSMKADGIRIRRCGMLRWGLLTETAAEVRESGSRSD